MRAAVLHAPGDLRLEDRPVPEPKQGEVLVAVRYNGLCGTDVTEFTKGPLMVPLTTRHPRAGISARRRSATSSSARLSTRPRGRSSGMVYGSRAEPASPAVPADIAGRDVPTSATATTPWA
jgi:hypothetical protein